VTTLPKAGSLACVGVSKRFGGVQAVRDVSLAFRPGQVTALIGPNGAGKTTIFNILTGQVRPDCGTVEFHGRSIEKLHAHQVARLGVGRTFQNVGLFDGLTALENVLVYAHHHRASNMARAVLTPIGSARDARRARQDVRAVLDRLNLTDIADTKVERLSYAQQKQVALARILALNPSVVLFDEPASGLDHRAQDHLTTQIVEFAREGRAVCVVEHNMDIVRGVADRVIFVSAGAVTADGSPEDIFNDRALADAYFGGAGR
jgi:ABC-type branched-subunit amino acid transport system ATPase component